MDPQLPEPRDGRPRLDDVVAYPPGPWHLRAELLVSVLRVPVGRLAGLADALPTGFAEVPVGGSALVGLASIRYLPVACSPTTSCSSRCSAPMTGRCASRSRRSG
jgi:hypothetical protein